MTAAVSLPADLPAAWRDAIAVIGTGENPAMQRLQMLSLRFVDGPWLAIALGHGWDEVELFGVFPAALQFARRRDDCLGLVPALALGGLSGKLVELGRDGAVIERSRNGSRLRHARHLGGRAWSIAWWEFFDPKETT